MSARISDERQRESRRRRRARNTAARPFERPIKTAYDKVQDERRQFKLDRLHDIAAAECVKGISAQAAPEPCFIAMQKPAAIVAIQVDEYATDDAPVDEGLAAFDAAPRVPNVLAATRSGLWQRVRNFRQSLMLPVILAVTVIGLSNRLPSWTPPGSHIAPAPAVSTSKPPDGTPKAASIADISGEVVVPSKLVPPLVALPPGESIAVISTPPMRVPDDSVIAARDTDFLPRTRACATSEIATFKTSVAPVEAAAFGAALAAAAEAQTSDFVVYNDEYYNLRYPGGDIPALYGVCSDVVIRAYRALGIDLQRLVHEARVGSGDTSIDHRRTETLRRFFARHATKLAVTDFGEDYIPGDIVTYERPQNRGAQAHIAIVSNETGPSGYLMIVHNRGWGPQLEDALFVDHITGHYRMSGRPRLLTSWGVNKSHGRGLDSWSTLIRRAAIVRGSDRAPKSKTTPKM